MSEKRPLRVCDLCGVIDDGPRALHMFAAGEAPAVPSKLIRQVARADHEDDVIEAAITELEDPTSALRHHECCADAGCPTETCDAVLDAVDGRGKKGDALLKALQSGGEKSQRAVDAVHRKQAARAASREG